MFYLLVVIAIFLIFLSVQARGKRKMNSALAFLIIGVIIFVIAMFTTPKGKKIIEERGVKYERL